MQEFVLTWNVEPEILWLTETFPLKYYGLLFVTGLFLGYYVVKRSYIKERIPIEQLDKLLTYIIIGILLGARLGHCFFYDFSYYWQHPMEILLPIKKIGSTYTFTGFQGLASHGGVIGVFIAIYLYCKKYKTSMLWILDKVALGAPITAAFIRLGNFMNSEIYGKPTNGKWGVIFQQDDMIPRHPTQLYEALAYMLVFVIIWQFSKTEKKKNRKGVLFGILLTGIFLARFIIEFFKENQVSFEDQLALNMGQYLSIPFVIIGSLLIINNYTRTLRSRNTY